MPKIKNEIKDEVEYYNPKESIIESLSFCQNKGLRHEIKYSLIFILLLLVAIRF